MRRDAIRTIVTVWIASLLVAGPASADFLGYVESLQDGVAGPGLDASAVAVSPDAKHVYVTDRHDAALGKATIAILRRDPGNGSVTPAGLVLDGVAGIHGLFGARAVLVSPDGAYVYVAAEYDGAVVVFRRDGTTGALTFVETQQGLAGLTGARTLALSPDGATLYVGGALDSAIAVFRRDAATGRLTFVAAEAVAPTRSVAPGVISAIAVSPDGANVYVAQNDGSGDDDALVVFRRDSVSGAISVLEAKRDGDDGFVSLGDFASVVVSPDGRFVYAGQASDPESVLVVFRRDAATGRLTAVQAQPFVATPLPSAVLLTSPDGDLLYAGGQTRLTVLARDPASGRVSVVASYEDAPGLPLDHIEGLAVDPNGRDVYVGATTSHVVTHMQRRCGNGSVGEGEACDDGNNRPGDGCTAACTVEACFACTGSPSVCAPADGAPCDAGDPCRAGTTCQAGRCAGGTPVADGTACDDGNACTTGDACAGGGCVGAVPERCGACEACDARYGCVGVFRSDCRRAPRFGPTGSLRLARAGRARSLAWRWVGDGATTVDELGRPTDDTGYGLCVLDRGSLPFGVRRRRSVVSELDVAAAARCGKRSCWHPAASGFVYADAKGRSAGLRLLGLRAAAAPKPSITVAASGKRLSVGPLPLSLPATAQLSASTGRCWSAEYDSFVPFNRRNFFAARAGERPPGR
jgi:cysteine-rich repeat protein